MELKVIGKRIPRVDALDRATGKAAYGADLHLPGMLYGKILRSPYPHAKILRINVEKALAMEGVKAVVTGKDFPTIPYGTLSPQGELNVDIWALSQVVIARERVFFTGQPVAALAATDPFTAEEALKLIEVEYEVLPTVMDVLQAMKPDAPLLHPELHTQEFMGERAKTPSNVALHIVLERGDLEVGFREADVVVENTYRTQPVHQGYIEPEAAATRVDSDGRITVWSATQGSFGFKTQLSFLLQIPSPKIRVIPMEIGGGFGGKIRTRVEPLCIKLSQKTGKPVRIVLTREEVLKATGPAPASVVRLKTGATRDGRLTAFESTLIYDAGAFPGAQVANGTLIAAAPYRIPNLRIEGYDVVTNKPKVGAYRAPCCPQANFAMEQHIDMMAEALNIDPLEFRRINAVEEGDPLPNDIPLNRVGFKAVLDRLARSPFWENKPQGPNRGRGLACAFWRGGIGTSSCHIAINLDGSIELVLGAVDLTGTRTTMAQVAAEEFGIPLEEVEVVVGDTSTAINSDPSVGSRITYTMSNAVHRACQDALSQLKQRAAAALKTSPDDIEYASKRFWVKHTPEKGVSLGELALASVRGAGPIVGKGSASRMQFAHQFSAHVADVEVDTETGKVKLLNYMVVQDVGLAVNPTQVEGQMQGGATQGIGWALWEEYIYQNGALRNATLLDYRMPTSLDIPSIAAEIVEVPAPDGPFGIRGVGENPIIPPPAALANAIYRACGIRLQELPMSPERVLRALKEKSLTPSPTG